MVIHEFNVPKRQVFAAHSPLVNPLLVRSFGDAIASKHCRVMWSSSSLPRKSNLDQHRQAPGLRGKWPTKEDLVLLRDPNDVSKKELFTKSPWELQKKRKSVKAEELDRIRKLCEARRDSVKKQSQLVNQQAFDNWLKGKIKARKEEALEHLRRLKVEEDRKGLFVEYMERKNIEEVEKWLLDKMSVLEEVINVKSVNEEMQKWYEVQKQSVKEKILKMWGYQYSRSLPKVDGRRCPKYSGYVTPEPKLPVNSEKQKAASIVGKMDQQVQFA